MSRLSIVWSRIVASPHRFALVGVALASTAAGVGLALGVGAGREPPAAVSVPATTTVASPEASGRTTPALPSPTVPRNLSSTPQQTPSPTPPSTPTAAPKPTAAPTPIWTAAPTLPPTPTPSLTTPQDATLDAALARCPTADEVALVDSVLTMTFAEDPTAPDLVCTAAAGSADLTRFQERAYQAILSMRRIAFDAPLPWTELPLFDWFTREVNGIIFRGTDSYCCEREGVLVVMSGGILADSWGQLWVSRDPNAAIGLMNSVDLLLHEARHSDGFPHTCGGGDDATLEEGGAWAVVYWYYIWLSEHAASPYMAPEGAEPDLYTNAATNQAAATLVRVGCD